jgi:hypothetical protein
MRKLTVLTAATMFTTGRLLGWLAGSCRLRVDAPAGPNASAAPAPPATEAASGDQPG